MKAVKILLKVLLGIVAVVVIALLALPIWFGPVVKGVANSVAPGVVKTDFHLGVLSLNPYSGRFELGDMQLSNPAGYSEKYAVTLGDIVFDCEPLSLASDVIHIEEIKVKGVFASLVSKDGVSNFKQIQYNVAGGKEKYEAAQAKKEAQPEEEKAEESKPKKVIIDRLEISDLKIQLGILPIALPSITLTDIGKNSGGATLEDAWNQIVEGVLKSAGAVGDQVKTLIGGVGDAAGKATEAATKAASQATEALGNVAGGATDAAGKAASVVGDTAGKATEAVGEGAKKALDSLKSLW